MRALIVLCLFAAANAAFTDVQSAAQPMVDAAVSDFLAEVQKGPGLAEYLGVPNNDLLMKVESDLQTELGQQLSQQLQQVLAQIQSAIDHGQMVGQSLVDKAKELLQNLSSIGANTFQLAQQFINELIQMGMSTIGNILGKRSVGSIVQGILSNIQGQISAAVDKLLAAIKQIIGSVGKRDLVSSLLQGLLDKILQGVDLSTIPVIGPWLQSLISGIGKRDLQDPRVWNLIVDSIKSIIDKLSGHFGKFKEWLQQVIGNGSTVLQGHIQNIKELAQQVLSHVNQISGQAIDQALQFFKPYQNDLGALWKQLQDAAKQIHAQITG